MSLPTGKLGNVKITRDDKILHWWKLNSNYDEGLNDKDFYTFWYSVCYLFGMIYTQTVNIVDVDGKIDLIKRFLSTFGVELNSSTSDVDVIEIQSEWMDEIKKRGTGQIANVKNLVQGICLKMERAGSDSRCYLTSEINLGSSYIFEFDCKMDTSTIINGYVFSGILSTPVQCNLVNFSWDSVSGLVEIRFYDNYSRIVSRSDTSIYHIKIIRNVHDFLVYINGDLVFNESGYLDDGDDVLSATSDFLGAQWYDGSIKIGNIKITPSVGDGYMFKMNTPSYYIYDDNKGVVGLLEHNKDLEDLFVQDDLFLNNGNYSKTDGELCRVLNRAVSDEFILPLLGSTDLDWNLNNGSPQSVQTYPIINFNKFQNKDKSIYRLDNLPVYINTDLWGTENISIDGTTIPNTSAIKITNIDLYSLGVGGDVNIYTKESVWIPVNESLDYEISFRVRMNADNANIKTFFFVKSYTSAGAELFPKSAKSAGDAETMFLNDTVGGLFANFIGKDLWVRGILYNSSKSQGEDLNGLNFNFGIGRNLIMIPNTKYIIPNILFYNPLDPANVFLWDIQVRPLSLNTSKGTLGLKNVILPYINNNGDKTDSEVTKIIREKLIPYNSLVKIKFL